MKDTKNGIQKSNTKKRDKISNYLQDYRKKHSDDITKISVLILFSFLSALIIQKKLSFDYLLSSFFLILIILLFFYKDIKRYKPSYLKDTKMLLLLAILVTGTLMTSKIFEYILYGLQKGLSFQDDISYIFGIPTPIGAMLVTLMFDFHTAIIFSFVMSLFTGMWIDYPLYNVFTFIGSLTAAFSVIRCKKRSALIKGGLYISAVNIITSFIILIMQGNFSANIIPATILFSSLSGILVASIVSIVLPFFEYAFGITTDISLIELLDLNQPLMHNLMVTAPGTYHHSVIVGNLAEAAAEAIGANPLLARVTAYYHDIGKIKMPEYFIENQLATVGKHEKLTPHMSSMILISHVKEGYELAKQYKLPKSVIDVIQQHHGTSLITYFYQKALEQQSTSTFKDDYRYPGPKPQSRVAAIVMMADAVEAASRTLTDATPARIAALVDKIINNIFLDGQIDECELTLKDISEIKKRFTHILTSIFHKRIAYPEIEHSVSKKTKTNGDFYENRDFRKEQSEVNPYRSSEGKEHIKKGIDISQR